MKSDGVVATLVFDRTIVLEPKTGLEIARDAIVHCNRCPRLRAYCRRIAKIKRRAFRDETYWARRCLVSAIPRRAS